jgi:hypothetical protein
MRSNARLGRRGGGKSTIDVSRLLHDLWTAPVDWKFSQDFLTSLICIFFWARN